MNRREKEIEIAKGLNGVLGISNAIDKDAVRWLYPLYPEENRKFIDREEGECVGDHKLLLIDMWDAFESLDDVEKEDQVRTLSVLHTEGKGELASMQIYGIWVDNETQISIITQTYGSSCDCDWTYPTFKYYDGVWVSTERDYPWVLTFDMYF